MDFNKRPRERGTTDIYEGNRNIFLRIAMYLFPWKGDNVKEILRKVVFLAALCSFIYFGISLTTDLSNEYYQKLVKKEEYKQWVAEGTLDMTEDEIAEVQEKVPEILPQYIKLYSENNDVIGWIKSEDTPIDYAVVLGDDNDYYIDHTIQGEYSKGGSIFADYRSTFSSSSMSQNMVLYGHNINSGEYFTSISYYHPIHNPANDPLQYYRAHPSLTFNTIYEEAEYKIFACVLFNTQEQYGEVYRYTNVQNFTDKHDFNNFILDIMDRSRIWTDVDVEYGDQLLTLSTCYWPYKTLTQDVDTRCVIFARKVREGESAEVDVSTATTNPNPLLFQLELDRGVGYAFSGRQWDTSKLLSYDGE